jgi:hypothetical protein
MKTRILFLMVLVCALASMANALDIRYMGSGPWETTANWVGGVQPGVFDAARFNWGNNTVTASTAVGTVDRVQAGVDESGTLHILSGGIVQSGTWTGAGVAGACTGTINIDAGGTLNTGVITAGGGHLWVAMNDGGAVGNVGIVNLSGTINVKGIIGLGTINAVTPSGGIGLVNVLDGGLLNLSNIAPIPGSIQPGSLLTVSGTGLVTLPGDFVASIQAYIDAGRISGAVVPVYDDMGKVIQTNIVVPEPVSISLLGLGALALLRKRS